MPRWTATPVTAAKARARTARMIRLVRLMKWSRIPFLSGRPWRPELPVAFGLVSKRQPRNPYADMANPSTAAATPSLDKGGPGAMQGDPALPEAWLEDGAD